MALRTWTLYLAMAVYTLTIGIPLILIAFLIPQKKRAIFLLTTWIRVMLFFVRWIGGVHWKIEGHANLKNADTTGVILSKHQSALETLLYQDLFYPALHIAKSSLQWIPVFGWGLKMIGTVFIDRSKTTNARQQILEGGKARMEDGNWLVIYPEGTRIPVGEFKNFKTGGASSAIDFGCKVYPVAHNAGEFWNKKGIVKTGVAHFVIGEGIDSAGREPKELTAEVQEWIMNKMSEISDHY